MVNSVGCGSFDCIHSTGEYSILPGINHASNSFGAMNTFIQCVFIHTGMLKTRNASSGPTVPQWNSHMRGESSLVCTI